MNLFQKLKAKFSKADKDKKSENIIYEKGLQKASTNLSNQLTFNSLKKTVLIDDKFYNNLENILISSDIGYKFSKVIVDKIAKKLKINSSYDLKVIQENIIEEILNLIDNDNLDQQILNLDKDSLNVILVVGVNGSGKTTSIAKIANYLLDLKYQPLIVAADTFRAAAVKQLALWAEKLKIKCVQPIKEFQDPASVVYDGIKCAKNENYNVVIIDTAGRLHSNSNLMAELAKIYNILKNKLNIDNITTLFVLDSTTGQNGINQAIIFKEATNVDGIILTKMDGTSRGGIILSIKEKLNIPVKFIGFGEKINDLQVFNLEQYLYNLIKPILDKE